MGSIFNPKPATAPTPPPPPAPSTYRDEIGGTEQVPVKNADGSVTYITRQLPLTEEQQAKKDELESIMSEAMAEIEALSSADYDFDDSAKAILNSWEAERKDVLNDSIDIRTEKEEQALASRGLGDSSAATAVRRMRRLDKQDALTQLDRERDLLAEDIRNQRIGQQQNLYNLAAGQSDVNTARIFQSAIQGQNAVSAINTTNRASIADYYNRQLGAESFSQSYARPTIFGRVYNTVESIAQSAASS